MTNMRYEYNKEQALLESNTSNKRWTIPPRLPIMWVPFQCYGWRLVGGHLPCHRNPSRHDNTWVTGPQDALFPRWQNILGPIYIRIQVSPYQPVKVKATLKFVTGQYNFLAPQVLYWSKQSKGYDPSHLSLQSELQHKALNCSKHIAI